MIEFKVESVLSQIGADIDKYERNLRRKAADYIKAKIKEKNPETGVSYEKYGHTSDANDYLLCYAFASEFTMYQKGGVSRPITVGSNNASKNSY
jgi:hypothetical protein